MSPATLFDGIIFDMDGVLCDSEPFIRRAACQMFAESHNTRVQPADFHPFTGAGEDRFIGGVAEKYGVKLSLPADKNRTYQIYLQMIKGTLLPLPGAVEFIVACRKKGLRLAVASSADRVKLDGNLKQLGLPASRFDAVVSGSEVEKKKPDPGIFLLAAARMRVPPGRCLVIEDSPNGLLAGNAAGARCLGITTTFDAAALTHAGADWTSPDLAHLPEGVLG
jgi:beta-phosphoglucomutase